MGILLVGHRCPKTTITMIPAFYLTSSHAVVPSGALGADATSKFALKIIHFDNLLFVSEPPFLAPGTDLRYTATARASWELRWKVGMGGTGFSP